VSILLLALVPAAQARPRGILNIGTKAVPGIVIERTKLAPMNFKPEILVVKINGRYADISHHRGCSLDSARDRVLVTIDACHGRRVTVYTATTGKRSASVFVKLAEPKPKPKPAPSA
jgi:hypothetical protein